MSLSRFLCLTVGGGKTLMGTVAVAGGIALAALSVPAERTNLALVPSVFATPEVVVEANSTPPSAGTCGGFSTTAGIGPCVEPNGLT